MTIEGREAERERALQCPSTHCNRREECCSPNECCSTGKWQKRTEARAALNPPAEDTVIRAIKMGEG